MTAIHLFDAHTGKHRAGAPKPTALPRPTRAVVLRRRLALFLLNLWDWLRTAECVLPPSAASSHIIPGPAFSPAARNSREPATSGLAGQARELPLADARDGLTGGCSPAVADESSGPDHHAGPELASTHPAAEHASPALDPAPTVPAREVAESARRTPERAVESPPATGAAPVTSEAGAVRDHAADEWDDAARFIGSMTETELARARADAWHQAAGLPASDGHQTLPGGRSLMRTGAPWWLRHTAADGLPRLGPATPVPAARPYTELAERMSVK